MKIMDEFTNLSTRGARYYYRHKEEYKKRARKDGKSNQFDYVNVPSPYQIYYQKIENIVQRRAGKPVLKI